MFTRFYRMIDFVALAGEVAAPDQFATYLATKPLGNPLLLVQSIPNQGLIVQWPTWPGAGDIAIVDASVADYTAAPMTAAPIVINSSGSTTSASGVAVTKIDVTTPPRAKGTYGIDWACMIKITPVAANTGVLAKFKLIRSDGANVEWQDAWDLSQPHFFGSAVTFDVEAGHTIRALLTLERLGASGIAEMWGARVSIDKIG
jgi:hypothetical protein